MLEDREFKWGHSKHRGYFIGMKLSLAMEYPSLKPLAFIVNEANVSEYTVYPQILEELKRRKKIRAGDVLYFDRTYAVELKNKNGKHLTVEITILLIRPHVLDFITQVHKSYSIKVIFHMKIM